MRMSLTEFKKLTAAQVKKNLPIDVTADGEIIGVFDVPGKGMVGTLTKCPNCKMEFTVAPSDNQAFFFTIKHP